MTKQEVITLDPKNEFEAAVIQAVKMHRLKSQTYGSSDDPLWNFYESAARMGSTPLDACDAFATKHVVAFQKWKAGDRTPTEASNDQVTDQMVYAIIRQVLYNRGAY